MQATCLATLRKVEGRSTLLATRNTTIIIAVAKWGVTREFSLATRNITFVALQVARKIALCNMALREKELKLNNLLALQGKRQCLCQHAHKHKINLTVNFLAFPFVKFLKIWQIGSNYFSRNSFFREICKTNFWATVKDKYAKIEKTALTTLLFCCWM